MTKHILVTILFLALSACATKPKSKTTETPVTPANKSAATGATAAEVAHQAPVEKPNRVVCAASSDERSIQVVKAAAGKITPGGNLCEVVYTKFGKSDVLASSKTSLEHCEGIKQRIQSKLETSGFKCQ